MSHTSGILSDTHCHLTAAEFDSDRSQVLQRAREFHIHRILTPGIDIPSSQKAIELADQYNEIYAAIGVHPHAANHWHASMVDTLRTMASHHKVIAIGEIGLDYYRDITPGMIQRQVLRQQLDLAADLDLPVVLHNREATGDLLSILSDWPGVERPVLRGRCGVLHANSMDQASSFQAIRLGFFVGIAGPITYLNAKTLRSIASQLPLARLIIETDAPYLTPHPHRGTRNEPAYVRFVAEKLADLFQSEYDTIAKVTYKNASNLFRWDYEDTEDDPV